MKSILKRLVMVIFFCLIMDSKVYAYEYPIGGSGVTNNGGSSQSSNNGVWNKAGEWGSYSKIWDHKADQNPEGKYWFAKERGVSFPKPIAASNQYEISISAVGYATQPSSYETMKNVNIQVQYQVTEDNLWHTLTRGVLCGYNEDGGEPNYVLQYSRNLSASDWPSYAIGKEITGLRIVVTNMVNNPTQSDIYCIDSFNVFVHNYDNPRLDEYKITGANYVDGNIYWFGRNSEVNVVTDWKSIYEPMKESHARLYSNNLMYLSLIDSKGPKIDKVDGNYIDSSSIKIEDRSISENNKRTMYKFRFINDKEKDYKLGVDANNTKELWGLNLDGKFRNVLNVEQSKINPVDTKLLIKTDYTKPIISDNVKLGWMKKSVNVQASAIDNRSGMQSFEIISNNTLVSNSTKSGSVNFTSDGIYSLKFKAIDNVGNISFKFAEVKIDKSAPQISYSNQGWKKNEEKIYISASDNTSGMNRIELYSKDNKLLASGKENLSYVNKLEGSNMFKVVAYDVAGNKSIKYITSKIDNKAPKGNAIVNYDKNSSKLNISIDKIIESESGLGSLNVVINGNIVNLQSSNIKSTFPLVLNEDLDEDGIVTNNDLSVIEGKRGSYNNLYEGKYDLNSDGSIDYKDINIIRQAIGKKYSFNSTIDIDKLLEKEQNEMKIEIIATDVVGNSKTIYSNTFDLFSVEAKVTNLIDNTNIFKRGEEGKINITTYNFVQKLKITFLRLGEIDTKLNKVIEIEKPSIKNEKEIHFIVPLSEDLKDGEYSIKIEAIKNNKSKYVYPKLNVKDSIINDIKTRIRIEGR